MDIRWRQVFLVFFLVCLSYAKPPLRHLESHRHHRLNMEDNEISSHFSAKEEKEALSHSVAVSEKGSCDLPRVQLVHVSDHYPDPQKYYLPHCTLLHRCGKHSGCCGTDRLRCVAASKEKVTLTFYSVRVLDGALPADQRIERLTFTNHTKCACVLKDTLKNDL